MLAASYTVVDASPSHAQDIEGLALACAGGSAELIQRCREGLLAARAAQSGVGLVLSVGASVPGSVTTLGKRFGGTPRIGVSVRGGVARFETPRLDAADPSAARRVTVESVNGSLAIGLFDGFSLLPALGGILSIDLLATAGISFIPDDAGFDGDPGAWGVGVRVGVMRESFTVPGVSISLARRSVGELGTGSFDESDVIRFTVRPTVWSARGVVGKDLLAIGVMAGAGWDRYSSDARLSITPSGPSTGRVEVEQDGLDSERVLLFGGLSFHRLILQLSAEGGWAQGFNALSGRGPEAYASEDGSLFFSAAVRLTL